MLCLNLINREKSDIGYTISTFPDGEVQISLEEFNRKDEINVRCRITNAEELFILMQVSDILVRHGIRFNVSIYYLMGMRMDRVMDFNRPFTLKLMINILDNLGTKEINIFSPHSDVTHDLFKNSWCYDIRPDEWEIAKAELNNYQLVMPDKGACDRYFSWNGDAPEDVVIGEKVRDVNTGKIISIEVKNPEVISNKPLLVRDDLCDGGGTFIGLAEAIKKIKPDANLNIIVDHMVNYKGIENLSKVFNHIWFTNSYKDWESQYKLYNFKFPKNITQINIV